MENFDLKNAGRRHFLRSAPIAAVAGLALADGSLFASSAAGQAGGPAAFQLFTAQAIQDDIKALQAKPGNDNFYDGATTPFAVVLTVETTKTPKEFEWHEGRDHVLQIIEGSTILVVGGTPKGGHSKAPGEWNAPESEGATSITMKKGDMLVIPRGTPHKRITADTVTLLLISPMGAVKA
jgi:mannose-6-phosphate isomerase-like protein (cupin superfamily)